MTRRHKAADAAARPSVNTPQSIPAGPAIDHGTLFPGQRARHDGWTPERTQRFLDVLAHTGCIEDACRVAGMSAVGARRMRSRFPAFAAAWQAALDRAHQGLIAIAYRRAVEGRETVIIRKGEEYERRIAPSDSILGLLVKRGDMVGGSGPAPDEMLTRAEWEAGWRFDREGTKTQEEDPEIGVARFRDRMIAIRERLEADARAGHTCLACGQTLPGDFPGERSIAELVATGVVRLDDLDG